MKPKKLNWLRTIPVVPECTTLYQFELFVENLDATEVTASKHTGILSVTGGQRVCINGCYSSRSPIRLRGPFKCQCLM